MNPIARLNKRRRERRQTKLAGIEAPVSLEMLQSTRLVMTLLVRDEEEIVERNLDFHYSMGVDFVIATDNGSRDRTPEILSRYEREGRLQLIHEKEHNYQQKVWVNRMGEIATFEHGANIVFHCDADEFWRPASGNLKRELLAHPHVDALLVPLVNILLREREGLERFPQDAVYSIVRPIPSTDLDRDSRETPLYLLQYPPSVMFTTRNGPRQVIQGNHGLVRGKNAVKRHATEIKIHHYPVLGRSAFYRKAIQGGRAYEANAELRSSLGFHWRRWYRAHQEGRLGQEYRDLILTTERARQLIGDGRVREIAPIG